MDLENDLQQGSFLCFLTQPEIIRKRYFKFTDIEYDIIKDGIARVERVEYNTAAGRNVMNVDDIEDFANF